MRDGTCIVVAFVVDEGQKAIVLVQLTAAVGAGGRSEKSAT